MAIKVKVCGMREVDNIRQIAALSPEYMGFIFYKQSVRVVGGNLNLSVVPKSVKKIGVFVNEQVDVVSGISKQYGLDMVQLHGNEPAEACYELKQQGLQIIKAFSINDDFDFSITLKYNQCCDYFLFDTKGDKYGGNGVVFNWKKLYEYNQQVPFFLSGGLSPSTIERVHDLKGMNLHAVDINSGVELKPGVKNVEMVRQVLSILNSIK